MEIVLNATEGQTLPSNIFVGMRIGDVQKQGKLVPSRTFAFPAQETGKEILGRIEIFQKVGQVAVKVASDSKGSELEVPCSLPGLETLCFKWSVKGGPQPGGVEKKTRTKKKMDSAQKYIAEHNLEDVLADAMRDLIRDRPDNPARYLSAQMKRLDPLAGTPSVPQLDETMRPPTPGRRSKEKLPPIDKDALSQPALKSVAPPPVPEVVVGEQMPPVSEIEEAAALADAPSKDVAPPQEPDQQVAPATIAVADPPSAPAVPATVDETGAVISEDVPPQTAASGLATDAILAADPGKDAAIVDEKVPEPQAPPKPPFEDFGRYYRENTWSASATAQAVYLKFQTNTSDSSDVRLLPDPIPSETMLPSVSDRTCEVMQSLPSTGTWVLPYPLRSSPDAVEQEVTEPWFLRPSTASWLRAPNQMERSWNFQKTDGSSPDAVEHEVTEPWFLRPSTASWLRAPNQMERSWNFQRTDGSAPDAVEQEAEPWFLRPSIASWLRAPDQMERPWQFRRISGKHAEYISELQVLLSKKDQEIEDLRRTLEAMRNE